MYIKFLLLLVKICTVVVILGIDNIVLMIFFNELDLCFFFVLLSLKCGFNYLSWGHYPGQVHTLPQSGHKVATKWPQSGKVETFQNMQVDLVEHRWLFYLLG